MPAVRRGVARHDPRAFRHCAHEVVFVVLGGLQYSLAATGHHDAAAHAAALREHLPVTHFGAS